jgi:hypothetical protein
MQVVGGGVGGLASLAGTALQGVGAVSLLKGLGGLLGMGSTAAAGTTTAATVGGGALASGAAATGGVLAAGAAGYAVGTLVDMAVEKATGRAMSTRLSEMFESDAEKAANRMMTEKIAPAAGVTNPVQQTADGITKQVDKMNETNTYLKQLTELATNQVELAEKQLAATTLTEKQKASGDHRSMLLQGNRYVSQYGFANTSQ